MPHPSPLAFPSSRAREALDAVSLRARAGELDGRDFRSIHRATHPVAVAFLHKLGVHGDQVEDVCQEVFLQMHRYLPTFRGEASLTTWMYRICLSEARRHRHRERRAMRPYDGRLDPDLATGGSLDGMSAGLVQCALSALASLPERRRTILVLFELDGLSGAQVAEVVGCSLPSVWRELHHARAAFMAAFEASDPPSLG